MKSIQFKEVLAISGNKKVVVALLPKREAASLRHTLASSDENVDMLGNQICKYRLRSPLPKRLFSFGIPVIVDDCIDIINIMAQSFEEAIKDTLTQGYTLA